MTHDEHQARHQVLHEAFDELIADYLRWNRGKRPGNTTMLELMEWSFLQTRNPSTDPGATAHSYSVCAHCGEPVTDPESHVCDGLQAAIDALKIANEIAPRLLGRKPAP